MILIVMGVSGAGKSTVGEQLARQLHFDYRDADDFHPAHNREKMGRGVALTDEDRAPWLTALQSFLQTARHEKRQLVLACSALKRSHRDVLRGEDTTFVFLQISPEVARDRLAGRTGHFFDPALLDSQFDTLERPARAIVVDAESRPDEIVAGIIACLQ